MSTQNKSFLDNVVGWIIGIPIVLVFGLLLSPFLIYKVGIDLPIQNRRRRRFLAEHNGLVLLCITNSSRYKFIDQDFRDRLKKNGINRIEIFNGTIPNNQLDNFVWDILINRSIGFPQLLKITTKGIEAVALKDDFGQFFKKKIDRTQLIGSISWKLKQNIWTTTH